MELILGAAQLGMAYGIANKSGKPTEEQAIELLARASKLGITAIDTALAYQDANALIGKYHANSTRKFHIINKISLVSNIEELILGQLEVLNKDAFECLMLHKPSDMQLLKEFEPTLLQLQDLGLISKVGVSIYNNSDFLEALQNPLVEIIQFPYNCLDNYRKRGEYIKMAHTYGKVLHARSIFLQGLFWLETLPPYLAELDPYLKKMRGIAQSYNLHPSKCALEYVKQTPGIQGLIVGVDTIEQLNEITTFFNSPCHTPVFEAINDINVFEIKALNPSYWGEMREKYEQSI